jgi:hypothetical protein
MPNTKGEPPEHENYYLSCYGAPHITLILTRSQWALKREESSLHHHRHRPSCTDHRLYFDHRAGPGYVIIHPR